MLLHGIQYNPGNSSSLTPNSGLWKKPYRTLSPHPNSPHTHANIPKAFHCFLKSQYNNILFLKVLVLLIYSLNKRRKKYQSLHKTVNRKPEASLSAIFWLMLGMAPSITAIHVELVFMSVKPSSINLVKQRQGAR